MHPEYFKDKVVIITGASSGIGLASARLLGSFGADVVMAARSLDKLQELAPSVNSDPAKVLCVKTDVTKEEDCRNLIDRTVQKYGRIDILMNAAGGNMPAATVPPEKTIFDLNLDAVKQVAELNLFGTVLPTMVFAKSMAESGKGSIINFASESALRPLTRVAGYGVAKAAVVNWTKYLCAELALKFGEGIRVNAIAPGFILSNQNRSLLTNEDGSLTPRSETILSHTPIGRFLEPDELVGTLHYLASDASKAVTGTVCVVDGGFDAFSI